MGSGKTTKTASGDRKVNATTAGARGRGTLRRRRMTLLNQLVLQGSL